MTRTLHLPFVVPAALSRSPIAVEQSQWPAAGVPAPSYLTGTSKLAYGFNATLPVPPDPSPAHPTHSAAPHKQCQRLASPPYISPWTPHTCFVLPAAPLAALQLSDPGGLQLEFTAPSYLTGTSKLPYAFGPTLRLRAGGIMKIKLVNEMIMEGNITEEQPHAFEGPLDTNLHTHGLWDPNGGWQLPTGSAAALYGKVAHRHAG